MIKFNELRITPNNENLIIYVSIEDANYFQNVVLDSIVIDTQDTYVENGPSSKAVFKYTVEEESGYIYIPYTTQISSIKENIETNGTITILTKENQPAAEDKLIATGMKIKISLGSQQKQYTVVVKGDIDGSGKVDVTDLWMLTRYQVKFEDALQKIVGEYAKAADVCNNDNIINLNDIHKLARVIVKAEEL
jgi:hypothetical protein